MKPAASRALVTLEIRIDPEADAMRVVRDQVRSLMIDHGWPSGQVDGVVLGLDEALMNACFHGGAVACGEPVELGVDLHADHIVFEVRDRGSATPRNGKKACVLPDDDSESGRGRFLMKSTMDEVRFEPREGGGTRVRLVKRR